LQCTIVNTIVHCHPHCLTNQIVHCHPHCLTNQIVQCDPHYRFLRLSCLYNDYDSDGKRPLGRSRLKWEDIIKINLQINGIGKHAFDGSGSGYGQVAGTCECGDEPLGSIKCGEFLDWLRTG
jgi:hypothetical protein